MRLCRSSEISTLRIPWQAPCTGHCRSRATSSTTDQTQAQRTHRPVQCTHQKVQVQRTPTGASHRELHTVHIHVCWTRWPRLHNGRQRFTDEPTPSTSLCSRRTDVLGQTLETRDWYLRRTLCTHKDAVHTINWRKRHVLNNRRRNIVRHPRASATFSTTGTGDAFTDWRQDNV